MIVCLEGINGSGKTALAQALADRWQARYGTPADVVDPVRHSAFGRAVWTAIMAADRLDAWAESLAFMSARLDGMADLLARYGPASDRLCVLERYAGAVVAYGAVAGADEGVLQALESILTRGADIARTVLVDTPGVVAASRLARQTGKNRFETQGPGYLESVRREYLRWARSRGIPVVDGTGPLADLTSVADDIVSGLAASRVEP